MDYTTLFSSGDIVELTEEYAKYNLQMVDALRAFRSIRKACVEQVDESTGKAISAAKADVLADASPEAHAYELARATVNNIEMMIKALSFQHENS